MRHVPADDSEDVSFQIPSFHDTTALLGERGLELGIDAFDDDDDGFGGGLDNDPFMTPLHASTKHDPLTLSELTPREAKEHATMAEQQPPQRQTQTTASPSTERSREPQWEKDKPTLVRRTLRKKDSVDDMFQRRKRDNYHQMGIDLSAKSTARLRRKSNASIRLDISSTQPKPGSNPVKQQIQTPGTHTIDTPKSTSRTKRPVLDKDAGIVKHKPRVSTKPILKPSKRPSSLPPSVLTRTLTTAPKWGDIATEVHQTSQRRDSSGSGITAIGGGLIDALVKYGEKLKDSLGFSFSAGMTSTPRNNAYADSQPSTCVPGETPSLDDYCTQSTAAGPSSRPLTLSDLTPSRPNRHQPDALTLSDLSPSQQNPSATEGNEVSQDRPSNVSPMRPPKKRSSNGTPSQGSKKGKHIPDPELAPSTFSQHSKNTRPNPPVKGVSKPRPLGPSRTVNQVSARPRIHSQPVSAAESGRPHVTVTRTRDVKGRSHGTSTVPTHRRCTVGKEQPHHPVSLTMPSGPAFASDVYRQLGLGKTHNERDRRDPRGRQQQKDKADTMPHFTKPVNHTTFSPDARLALRRLGTYEAPPARPAVRVRPTIPAAFTFQSEARAAQRSAEFEEKRKTWETHATRHVMPIPDFAAMHAAQAEASRNRRVVPVLPTAAPVLTTMARAKDREKFDAERREREKAIEQQLQIREREREEQEEREYREARKRTVPKAHEVPEWYKDLRKRKETLS